jgi:hypothetical protein
MANPNNNGNGSKKPDELDSTPLPPRKQLPKSLQSTLDSDEKLWDLLYEGKYVSFLLYSSHLLLDLTRAHAPFSFVHHSSHALGAG